MGLAHLPAARRVRPPRATATTTARPARHCPSPGQLTLPPVVRRNLFIRYRFDVVMPRVTAFIGRPPIECPLPWGWLATTLATSCQHEAFAVWWHIRVKCVPPVSCWTSCPACSCPEPTNKLHLTTCRAIGRMACHYGLSQAMRFASLVGPQDFRAKLALACSLMQGGHRTAAVLGTAPWPDLRVSPDCMQLVAEKARPATRMSALGCATLEIRGGECAFWGYLHSARATARGALATLQAPN